MAINQNLAFIFPGQGSQKIGMLAELAEQYPGILKTFAEASEVLGYDVWSLIQNGSQEDINQTERTQPILLTSSVAIWRIWQESNGGLPKLLAGHSLGEWSALVCGGVIDFADAVNLVRLRGSYMQQAVPVGQGAMAAVLGLDDTVIADCCKVAAQGEEVAPVNFNAPGQVVIAGTSLAVDRAIKECKEAGAKRALPLPVSAPFHTTLMTPAAEKLSEDIATVVFNPAQIPVVQNVNGAVATDPDTIRSLLIEQIYSPVRWVDCVEMLVKQGVQVAVECGPGKVLSGLNKRIEKNLRSFSIDSVDQLNEALATI
jgi:[acyl-carrier-protein] S-malonyltransferase